MKFLMMMLVAMFGSVGALAGEKNICMKLERAHRDLVKNAGCSAIVDESERAACANRQKQVDGAVPTGTKLR